MRISDWSSDVCSSDLELEHGGSPFSAPTPGPERQILVNEDAQRPSGANGDGGLEVEVLADDLLSGLAGRLLGRLANGAHEIAFIVADRQFGADAKQGRKPDALEQLPAMEVDLILEPGITGGIGGGPIVDPDR